MLAQPPVSNSTLVAALQSASDVSKAVLQKAATSVPGKAGAAKNSQGQALHHSLAHHTAACQHVLQGGTQPHVHHQLHQTTPEHGVMLLAFVLSLSAQHLSAPCTAPGTHSMRTSQAKGAQAKAAKFMDVMHCRGWHEG